jgi:hypothetical protein
MAAAAAAAALARVAAALALRLRVVVRVVKPQRAAVQLLALQVAQRGLRRADVEKLNKAKALAAPRVLVAGQPVFVFVAAREGKGGGARRRGRA